MTLVVADNARDWLIGTPDGRIDASDFGMTGVRWKLGEGTFADSTPVEAYADDLMAPGLGAEILQPVKAQAASQITTRERRTGVITLHAATPKLGSRESTIEITVQAPAGVATRNVHLKRNGVLVKTWMETFAPGTALRAQVDIVAGENRFTAYAFNQDDVKTEDAETVVTGDASLKRPGELWVIAIGIDDYKNRNFHLNYAASDARLAAWSLLLERREIARYIEDASSQAQAKGTKYSGGNLTASSGAAHIFPLLDADATRARILDTVREVARQARPEDAIVLYYAGHGISIGDRYYLVPQDLPFDGLPSQLVEKGANALAKGGISDLDLRDALSAEQASEAAIILDACQSGAVTGNQVVQRRGPMDSAGLRQFAWDKGIDILAASLSTNRPKSKAVSSME